MLAMEFAYFQMSVTMTEVAGGHLNRRKRQIQLTSFINQLHAVTLLDRIRRKNI